MLDFKNHKEKWKEQFPTVSEEELERIFHLLVQFWEGIIENYELFRKKDDK